MKTQYYAACSLDGFIATPDDSLDWLFSLVKLEDTSYPRFIEDVGAMAMGSATYDFILKGDQPWPYTQPAWIFTSRRLPRPAANITLCKGDVRAVHAEMKAAARGKNIWLVGGGELVGQFLDAGLVDELIVQVGSVFLGAGKPLLPRSVPFPKLQLTSVQSFGAGMAELRYAVR